MVVWWRHQENNCPGKGFVYKNDQHLKSEKLSKSS